MNKRESFRPLLDFEKQIDEAFVRYSSKLKKRKKGMDSVSQIVRSISVKNTGKLSVRRFN